MNNLNREVKNFLPNQYNRTNKLLINHNYLEEQFSDVDDILMKIREVVVRGDFTLGNEVDKLEEEFAKLSNTKYAISVGSGTDALLLSLKALGVGPGDEVITSPFTFFATVGSIVTAGAKPVFVDIKEDYNIDPDLIESKVTRKTKAIMPVHWSGRPCNMNIIESIGRKYNIPIVSDSCHAIKATFNGRQAGELGTIACFSFHPLKNLNIWGDGGIITTNSNDLANTLKIIRNHGLINRDTCQIFAYNSRLDTIQAVVARHMMNKISNITECRIRNAKYYDKAFKSFNQIKIPNRISYINEVFHLYSILVEDRDNLKDYLIANNIDAKIHYPIPMHLQPAAKFLGHKIGDFPISEKVSNTILSLPVHEFITEKEQIYIINLIKKYYENKK